jgi:hypothetical protein
MNDCPPGAVVCDNYSIIERQERGGWCAIEMIFVQAGQLMQGGSAANQPTADTSSAASAAAIQTMTDANNSTDFGYPALNSGAAGFGAGGQTEGFGYPAYGIGANPAPSVPAAVPLGSTGIGHQ